LNCGISALIFFSSVSQSYEFSQKSRSFRISVVGVPSSQPAFCNSSGNLAFSSLVRVSRSSSSATLSLKGLGARVAIIDKTRCGDAAVRFAVASTPLNSKMVQAPGAQIVRTEILRHSERCQIAWQPSMDEFACGSELVAANSGCRTPGGSIASDPSLQVATCRKPKTIRVNRLPLMRGIPQ
jgi:hypothetical protein